MFTRVLVTCCLLSCSGSLSAGDIDAEVKVHARMLGHERVEACAELLIAGAGLDEVKIVVGPFESVIEEGCMMAIARGVEADADGDGPRRWRGDGASGWRVEGRKPAGAGGVRRRRGRRLGTASVVNVVRRRRSHRRGPWALLAWTRHDRSPEKLCRSEGKKCVAASRASA